MKNAAFLSHNIISSLGFSTLEVFKSLLEGKIGIKENKNLFNDKRNYFASFIDKERLLDELTPYKLTENYTKFEQIVLLSVIKATKNVNIDLTSPKTLFILSTTKGNIDLLDEKRRGQFPQEQLYLWKTGSLIAEFFQNPNQTLVISTACISGVVALITAQRLISQGYYENIVICGADVVSRFVATGFSALNALSDSFCLPYDTKHDGLNLGEGAATVVLSSVNRNSATNVIIENGAITNDANHISGPSRTGEGLYLAINQVLENFKVEDLAFVNSHGTATIFNDDMESIAFHRAGLSLVPISSLKGALGHTMGAAGVIESAITAEALTQKITPKTIGFSSLGTPEKINVIKENYTFTKNSALKTASGFGGANAAVLFSIATNNY